MSADVARLDETFAALADPARRGIVDLLRGQPLRSSEIADALSLSRPAASRHLRILRRAGVVREQSLEDDARARVYQLRSEPLANLRDWAGEAAAFWEGQLAGFKEQAERGTGKRRA